MNAALRATCDAVQLWWQCQDAPAFKDRGDSSLESRINWYILTALMRRISWLILWTAAAALPAASPPSVGKVDYGRDILPILSDNCYQCHGPDEKARKAKLRLDRKESAFRVMDDVTVIKPGDSRNSELVRRITNTDPDEMMPPPKSNRKLTPKQIELLTRWIDQ